MKKLYAIFVLELVFLGSILPFGMAHTDEIPKDLYPGAREQPSLNFTYLIADAVGFGSTAFRIHEGNLDIFIEAFPGSGTQWDPASVTKADIIIQSPHGHISHYDANTVAMVQSNTDAFVVGNTQLKNDMLGRGVPASKIKEIAPSLGQNESTTVLGVKVTAFRMLHTATNDEIDSFIIEMPSGIKFYHATCTSASSVNSYMVGHTKFYGLNVMILDYEHDFATMKNTFYPEVLMKVHDYQTGLATVWTDYPSGQQILNHNNTFQYQLPEFQPELSNTALTPTSGDTTTDFQFSVKYKYQQDLQPTKSQVVIGSIGHDMTPQANSGWSSGVEFRYNTSLSGGTHSYHYEFEVDSKAVRLPVTGELSTPYVNNIPVLSDATFTPMSGDTDTEFMFNVTYTDTDDDTPSSKKIFIDGIEKTMTTTDNTYTDGAIFTFSTKLDIGSHEYHFAFSDGSNEIRFPSTGALIGPDVERANYAPQLSQWDISPSMGTVTEQYTYSIIYMDAHNDPPTSARVFIDDTGYDMESSDTNYIAGAKFTYTTGLERINHTYHFEFSDGVFDVRAPPNEDSEYEGPLVVNLAPEVVIDEPENDDEFTTDDLITFDGSSSYDDDGDDLVHEWTSDIDGVIGTDTVIEVSLSEGEHVITLKVDDGFGGTDETSIDVTVVKLLPLLDISIVMKPSSPVEGQQIEANVTIMNKGEASAIGIWANVTLDGEVIKSELIQRIDVANMVLVQCQFTAVVGPHRLGVSLPDGTSKSQQFEIKERAKPKADAGGNKVTQTGQTITIDASHSISPGIIIQYLWDFGDNTNGSGVTVQHSYESAGTYTVTLRIIDDLGKEDTTTITVEVKEEDIEIQDSSKETSSTWIIGAIVGIVVIVIIIIAILIVLKKKPPATGPTPQQPTPPYNTGQIQHQGQPPVAQTSVQDYNQGHYYQTPTPVTEQYPSNYETQQNGYNQYTTEGNIEQY